MQKDTIIRTIVLAIALLNQMFAMFGIQQLNIDEETIYQAVTAILTIGSAVWAWWKNNSFTKAAQEADKVLKELKK